MVGLVCLHEKEEIEQLLRKNIYLNIYGIGDLDDFFWPYTTWYGLEAAGTIGAIALLYAGQALPALLALSEELPVMKELLKSILHLLPCRFYAHLSPGLERVFDHTHDLMPHGEHHKMGLADKSIIPTIECSDVVRLITTDEESLLEFYSESYPGNWFDSRMLESHQYFGMKRNGRLVSVSGIHVYSLRYGVAALGNIATHPSQRGRGFGTKVTARLCQSLLASGIDHVGLNVKADNLSAIACYEKLGFETIASYGEFAIQSKR